MESNDSPEIPDRGETSDLPGLPSGDLSQTSVYVRVTPMTFPLAAIHNAPSLQSIQTPIDQSDFFCLLRNLVDGPGLNLAQIETKMSTSK